MQEANLLTRLTIASSGVDWNGDFDKVKFVFSKGMGIDVLFLFGGTGIN